MNIITRTCTMTIACAIGAALILSACGKKETTTSPQPEAQASPSGPSDDDMMSAMLRGHRRAEKVCIDTTRDRAFIMFYPKDWADEKTEKVWYFIEKVEFYQLSNGTWFIIDQRGDKYVRAWPDTSGLKCKLQSEIVQQ